MGIRTSANWIKQKEGFSAQGYKFGKSDLIGYGTPIRPEFKKVLTPTEAEQILIEDLLRIKRSALTAIQSQNKSTALLSVLYSYRNPEIDTKKIVTSIVTDPKKILEYLPEKNLGQSRRQDELNLFQNTESIDLAVPYYSQRDNLLQPYQSCNVTSVAMVTKYYLGAEIAQNKSQISNSTYKQLEDQMSNWLTINYGPDSKYLHSRLVELMKKYGLTSNFSINTAFAQIKANLIAGNPVIYSGRFTAPGHIIVIKGYNDKKKVWICNDPYGNYNNGYTRDFNGANVEYSYDLLKTLSYTGVRNQTWAHLISV